MTVGRILQHLKACKEGEGTTPDPSLNRGRQTVHRGENCHCGQKEGQFVQATLGEDGRVARVQWKFIGDKENS
jgi:hypothetical protein